MQAQAGIATGTVLDIAGTGLSISTDVPSEPGKELAATSSVEDVDGALQFIQFRATVRSCRAIEGAVWVVGAQLSYIDDESWRRLMTFCYVVYPMRQLRKLPEPTHYESSAPHTMKGAAVLEELGSAVSHLEQRGARPNRGPSGIPLNSDGVTRRE